MIRPGPAKVRRTKAGWADKMVGRLAMREEGTLWNAYYAMPDTMRDAIYLGGIQMRFVLDKKRKAMFMGMMKDAVADIIEERTGVRPVWPHGEQPAPEHERTKE